ncbi:Uncharacterized protein ImpA, partial [hydrothermal vent metagenome]
PISEENPAGIDIREDSSPTSIYYAIKDARKSARAAERSNMFDGDNSEADTQWHKVSELAPQIIQNQTKDLEIASWYTEALIRQHGMNGLKNGFQLIHGLVSQYWDSLYPMPDEDGIETRVAPLIGLNGEGAEGVLITPIRNVYITEGTDPGPFNFWMYQQTLDIEKIADNTTKKNKTDKLGFSLEDINQNVTQSSVDFFINLCDNISISIETYRSISHILDENCGAHESPPTSNIINILEECLGTVKHLGKDKIPVEVEIIPDNEQDEIAYSGEPSGQTKTTVGPIKNRNDAFKKLTELSDFFRKTEPHSPISYILERAVTWGEMPLNDLIKELIPDTTARDIYGSLTGIKTENKN